MTDPAHDMQKRRAFLKRSAALGALLPAAQSATAQQDTPTASPRATPAKKLGDPAIGYLSLGGQEAAFVEALVDTLCPADELTPRGTDCGLAVYIDRQLAGDFGHGARRYATGPFLQGKPQHGLQLPLTPEQHFKAGIEAAEAACQALHQRQFSQLDATRANAFLERLAEGHVDSPRLSLATWFNELVYPLFGEACFADPIYGGNIDKVFWKLIGYPGLPATNAINIVRYRGIPFPGASDPKSIADFS